GYDEHRSRPVARTAGRRCRVRAHARGEGLPLRPGRAPREPAAPERSAPQRDADGGGEDGETLWSVSADSPPEPPSAESVARARAAHPAAGGRGTPRGSRGGDVPRELDDDEVV